MIIFLASETRPRSFAGAARSKQRAATSNQRTPGAPKEHGSSTEAPQKHPRYDTRVLHIGVLFSQSLESKRIPGAQTFPP